MSTYPTIDGIAERTVYLFSASGQRIREFDKEEAQALAYLASPENLTVYPDDQIAEDPYYYYFELSGRKWYFYSNSLVPEDGDRTRRYELKGVRISISFEGCEDFEERRNNPVDLSRLVNEYLSSE